MAQLINAGELGRKTDDREIDFLFSVIEAIEPRNVVNGMIAAQMATLHVQIMRTGRHLNRAIDIQLIQILSGMLIKMNKTFAAQAETLLRLRTGGGQNLTVGQLSVGQGGQAIVGNIMSTSSAPGANPCGSQPVASNEEEPSGKEK
jgi:hypothetical protein